MILKITIFAILTIAIFHGGEGEKSNRKIKNFRSNFNATLVDSTKFRNLRSARTLRHKLTCICSNVIAKTPAWWKLMPCYLSESHKKEIMK